MNTQEVEGGKGSKRVEGHVIRSYKFIRWLSTREEKEAFKLRDHVNIRTYGCQLATNILRLEIKEELLKLQTSEIRQGSPTS